MRLIPLFKGRPKGRSEMVVGLSMDKTGQSGRSGQGMLHYHPVLSILSLADTCALRAPTYAIPISLFR